MSNVVAKQEEESARGDSVAANGASAVPHWISAAMGARAIVPPRPRQRPHPRPGHRPLAATVTSVLLLAKPCLSNCCRTGTTRLVKGTVFILMRRSLLLPRSSVVLEPLEMMIPRRERLLRFWLKLPMKLPVGGQRLRVVHMHGDTVLLRNETRRIIARVANQQWPCAPGKQYYGHGPIQISYNYNYGPAGRAIGSDLLANPDLVAADVKISFRAAL